MCTVMLWCVGPAAVWVYFVSLYYLGCCGEILGEEGRYYEGLGN